MRIVMRVLMTVMQFDKPSGTETGIIAMARALTQAGHRPMVYSPALGWCAKYCHDQGIAQCFSHPNQLPRWDVVWGNHPVTMDVMKIRRTPVCQIMHDMVAGAPSMLNPVLPRVDAYFAVTRSMQKWLIKSGLKCAGILPQPIDLGMFRMVRPLVADKRTVLWSDSGHAQCEQRMNVVQMAAEYLGYNFLSITGQVPQDEMPGYLNRADIVVGATRAAIEGALCGSGVVVMSAWPKNSGTGLSGYVGRRGFQFQEETNWDGSYCASEPTVESIVSELKAYDPTESEWVSRECRRNHDSHEIVRRLLEWSKGAMG